MARTKSIVVRSSEVHVAEGMAEVWLVGCLAYEGKRNEVGRCKMY